MTLQDFQKSDDNKAHVNKCQTDEKVIYEHDLESISQTEKQSQTQQSQMRPPQVSKLPLAQLSQTNQTASGGLNLVNSFA